MNDIPLSIWQSFVATGSLVALVSLWQRKPLAGGFGVGIVAGAMTLGTW